MALFPRFRPYSAPDGAALLWAAAIWTAPWLGARTPVLAPVVGTVYLIGSLVCHQLPDRSFHLAGAQLPVCARCTGLYLGAALGVAAFRLLKSFRPTASGLMVDAGRAAGTLVVAAVPTALTLVTAAIGVWDPPNGLRFSAALPLGMAAGAVLAAVRSRDLR